MAYNINMSPKRNPMPTQDAHERAHNFNEVALGYSEEAAINEAFRCLNCKNMPCVDGCPVKIRIPEFIAAPYILSPKTQTARGPVIADASVGAIHICG